MKPRILAGVIAALLLLGGGAFALSRFMRASEDEALAFVPPDAYAYVNVFIRPSNSQKMALDDVLQKIPGIDSTEEAIQKLIELVDDELAEEGYRYDEDVEPWLGDQFAFFTIPGVEAETANAAALIETKDDDAALAFFEKVAEKEGVDLEERSYKGVTYEIGGDEADELAAAVLDGFLAVGTEEAVKESIDTADGDDTLETSPKFADAIEPLRSDWIGMFYLDFEALFETLAASQPGTASLEDLGVEDQQPLAAVLYAESDAFVFETSGGVAGGDLGDLTKSLTEPGLLPQLPSKTWGAFGVPSFGRFLEATIDSFTGAAGIDDAQLDAMFYAETGLRLEEDLLSWLGDIAVFVQGTSISDIGGGVVVESEDRAKSDAFLRKMGELLQREGLRPQPYSDGTANGLSIQLPDLPAPLLVLSDRRFVVGFGAAAAAAASGEGDLLEGSAAFEEAQEAVGDDFNIQFFIDVDSAQAAFETFGGSQVPGYEETGKKYADAFNHVIAASKLEDGTLVSKFVIGLE